MADDLTAVPKAPDASTYIGDARRSASWDSALTGRCADAVITSPPYLNNFDYADATRLELYFWGMARSWKEMTTGVRDGMIIATTQQSRVCLAERAMTKLDTETPRNALIIRHLIERLRKERLERRRGKEYDRVLPSYFADLIAILTNIRYYSRPSAPILFVLGDSAPYGIHIDTPRLLALIAEELGFVFETMAPIRQRGLRWHTNGSRHAVSLSEQLVILRTPNGR
jgi:hypothetical protein